MSSTRCGFLKGISLYKENGEDYVINGNSYERWIAKEGNNKAGKCWGKLYRN